MPFCIVKNCKSNSKSGRLFFSLPSKTRNIARRQAWLKYAHRDDSASENYKFCDLHFSESQFEVKKRLFSSVRYRKTLKWTALPDIEFPPNVAGSIQTSTDNKWKLENSAFLGFLLEPQQQPKLEIEDHHLEDFQCPQLEENSLEDDRYPESMSSNTESMFSNNIRISELKNELKSAKSQIKELEERILNLENKSIFNADQNQFLAKGSGRGIKWCEETLRKSVKLYIASGIKGYEEICRQKLPYPAIGTLKLYMKHMRINPEVEYARQYNNMSTKIKPEIEHVEILTPKVEPEEQIDDLHIDNIYLQPKLEYDAELEKWQ